jgi:hypothetical protein
MTLCAGGMRSSFNLALAKLKAAGTDASSLGLGIGFEYGPMTATRLGMKGNLIRCSVSRGVLTAEREQQKCTGVDTALGPRAYKEANDAVRNVFGQSHKRANLDYDTAVKELSDRGDKFAKAAKGLPPNLLRPVAAAVPSGYTFPDRAAAPAKPDGFA